MSKAPSSSSGGARARAGFRWSVVILISLGVHAGIASLLRTYSLFPPIEESSPLVVTRIAPPPFRPEARPETEILTAMEKHTKGVELPRLEAAAPRLDPPTIALPSALPFALPLLPGLTEGGSGELNWTAVHNTVLPALEAPDIGRRGAFEGTLYHFKSIKRVRSKSEWFKGRNKQVAEDKSYTYRCQFPGRVSASDTAATSAWIGMDYHATVHLPESEAGLYRFRLTSEAGAIFQIDGEDVIDHDGKHEFRPKEGELTLAPGVHTLRLAYILGPRSELGVILHAYRVGSGSWQVFDLRPWLAASLARTVDPSTDETLRVEAVE